MFQSTYKLTSEYTKNVILHGIKLPPMSEWVGHTCTEWVGTAHACLELVYYSGQHFAGGGPIMSVLRATTTPDSAAISAVFSADGVLDCNLAHRWSIIIIIIIIIITIMFIMYHRLLCKWTAHGRPLSITTYGPQRRTILM